MGEPLIKDWMAILNSQFDELLLDEPGTLRAIELCAEALAEIEPIYVDLFTLRERIEALKKAYQGCYDAVERLRG